MRKEIRKVSPDTLLDQISEALKYFERYTDIPDNYYRIKAKGAVRSLRKALKGLNLKVEINLITMS